MNGIVGFVGLGVMGLPLVRRLATAGRRLVVYDRDDGAVGAAASVATPAADLAEVVAAADVLMTCLPNPAAVEEVYGRVAKPGLLACDLSTVGPSLAGRLHAELARRGVAYVECPMLGGVDEAAAGTLFLILSGEPGDVERVMPFVRLIGRDHRYVGAPGNASRFKTVQNGLGLVQLAAIAEALALLARAGADLDAFIDVAGAGGGMAATPLFRAKAPMMVDPDPPVRGSLHIGAKDSALAAELAQELGLELPLFARAASLFRAALDQGLAGADVAAVARSVERETGVRIGMPGLSRGSRDGA